MHLSDWIGAHKWWRGGWGVDVARIDLRRLVNMWRFAIALSLVLAAAIEASPTTFLKMSLEQLSSATPIIVRARCQGSIASAVRGEIWTVTSFEVREVWKGNAPAVVRVRLLGGRTAEFTSHVEGVPRFRAGEDLVLFLAPLRRGDYSVTGWAQGAFRISRGGAGAPSWHVSPIGGLNVSGPWRMGRHLVVISLIGGARLDLSQAELAARTVARMVELIGQLPKENLTEADRQKFVRLSSDLSNMLSLDR